MPCQLWNARRPSNNKGDIPRIATSAAYGSGRKVDTPPLKGCCTAPDEQEHYNVMRDIGWTVNITPTIPPSPVEGYMAVFSGREAQSDPQSWSNSYLDCGVRRATALEIISEWRVNHSIIT